MTEYRALLEHTGEQVQPKEDAFERLARARDRRNLNRRVLTGLLAIVAATCGTLAAFMAFSGSGSPSPADATTPQTYHDERGGWSIDYPSGWYLSHFDEGLRVHAQGIRISNFEVPSASHSAAADGSQQVPDMSFLRSFPSDGVLVQLWQTQGGPMRMRTPVEPDSRFPVSLSDLAAGTPASDDLPRSFSGEFVGNGESYDLAAWIGPDASQEDFNAAARTVRSWAFEPLTTGTSIGTTTIFYVLGVPERYPVGSVRRFDREDIPRTSNGEPSSFYLLHVDDGFYAIAWPLDQADGYTNCGVRYEQTRGEFSCPDGARWDLRGHVIEKPTPGRCCFRSASLRDDPLTVWLVRISLDGHVLVSPQWFMPDPSQDLALT